ncbi:MAG: uroporphyrinogen-III synthase [Bacteroidota bacterium]|nr:uroporphyrinogen-III synthase [Bacteroidota bacterium]
MGNKLIHIACTRFLEKSHKSEAENKGIRIHDDSFVNITFPDQPLLVQTLRDNTFPLIFTSSYAVAAVARLVKKYAIKLINNNAFCISGKTKTAALENGFMIMADAPNALKLANEIILSNVKEVLHCTANIRRDELREQLQHAGITLNELEVYHKQIISKVVEDFNGVMFFSPSQADAFLQLNKLMPEVPAFCVGSTTANHLAELNHSNIIISKTASEQDLLTEVFNYYNQHT